MRRIESEVIVLPLPDSPTMPMVSPLAREKLTPSTALTTRSPTVAKEVHLQVVHHQ